MNAMRLKTGLAACLALAATTSAQGLVGDDYRSGAIHACRASAKADGGEVLFATVYLDAAGKALGNSAVWRPASTDLIDSSNVAGMFMNIGFEFVEGTLERLGVQSKVQAEVVLIPDYGKAISDVAAGRKIAGYALTYAYDGAVPARLAWRLEPADPNWSGLRSYVADLPAAPAGAKVLSMRLIDAAGRDVLHTDHAIAATGQRDRLYRAAMRGATELAETPEECWKIKR